MNSEVKEALSGIKSAWKNMLLARDKETYNFWSEEQLRLQKIYELMKHAHPQMVGYTADCHEITDDEGEVIDIHTRFFMDKGGEE